MNCNAKNSLAHQQLMFNGERSELYQNYGMQTINCKQVLVNSLFQIVTRIWKALE